MPRGASLVTLANALRSPASCSRIMMVIIIICQHHFSTMSAPCQHHFSIISAPFSADEILPTKSFRRKSFRKTLPTESSRRNPPDEILPTEFRAPPPPPRPRPRRFWAQGTVSYRRHGASHGAPRRAAPAPAAPRPASGPPRHAPRPPAGGRRAAKARHRAQASLKGRRKAKFSSTMCRPRQGAPNSGCQGPPVGPQAPARTYARTCARAPACR